MRPHPLLVAAWLAPAVPALACGILITAAGGTLAVGIATFGLGFAYATPSAYSRPSTAADTPQKAQQRQLPNRPERMNRKPATASCRLFAKNTTTYPHPNQGAPDAP